jgi:hypothetical protein
MARHPRVRVTARANRSRPGAVLLAFVDPCPYCSEYHHHGNPTAALDADGTYGYRVPHCAEHTHELRPDDRRARVNDRNRCRLSHPLYLLVPAEGMS